MKDIKRDFRSRLGSDPLGGLRGWGRDKKKTEYGHDAYQIKGNDACSNMVANVFPADLSTLGMRSKGQIQLSQKMVMLHINLKGMTNAATWSHGSK